MDVAQAVAEGSADVGLGVEAVALAYGLGFVPLQRQRYDLVILEQVWDLAPVQALQRWLASPMAKELIASLGGYETNETGQYMCLGP